MRFNSRSALSLNALSMIARFRRIHRATPFPDIDISRRLAHGAIVGPPTLSTHGPSGEIQLCVAFEWPLSGNR